MAPRVHLLWCAIACAPRSTAERVLADPANFVVVHNASTYVLHRCGGCRWMPPLERLLNASRAANGVDDASAADALAAVWETRVLFTGKL